MEYSPSEKGIMGPIEYILKVYGPNGKGIILWKIVFRSGNRHGKRLKKYSIKDNTSIKISLLCIAWSGLARVMLGVVFKEFEMVYIFYNFFFSLSLTNSKGLILAIIWWSCSHSPALPRFQRVWVHTFIAVLDIPLMDTWINV